MIDPQYIGVAFRQITAGLRVRRGGRADKLVSFRPRTTNKDGSEGGFSDSAENPTLITFDERCEVDVAALLAQGAIVRWEAPAAPKAKPAPKAIKPDDSEEGRNG